MTKGMIMMNTYSNRMDSYFYFKKISLLKINVPLKNNIHNSSIIISKLQMQVLYLQLSTKVRYTMQIKIYLIAVQIHSKLKAFKIRILMLMWMTLIGLINDISRAQSEREEEILD